MIARIITRIAGARGTLTLLALAIVAGGLYAWGATIRADRDRLIIWADRACARTGTGFAAATVELADGKRQSFTRGVQCEQRIANLSAFERDSINATSAALIAAIETRDRKTAADVAEARKYAARAQAAAAQMEQANAQISTDDRVGGAWFGALNRLGGLRPPAD